MKWLVIFLILLMTGCSGRIDLSDLATSAGAGVGAVAGAATGLGPIVTATTTVAGGIAGGAIVPDQVSTAEACANSPETCTTIAVATTVRDFIHWIIGGTVLLIIAAWLIPGPQTLWRRKDANTGSTYKQPPPGRFNP